jgi:predicted nucleotidyltransferase
MDLLDFLNRSSDARLIFGERELVIIKKQFLGVRLTQSERNRLSRSIRPKFAFVKDAARFDDEFKIKPGARIKRIVKETVDMILQDPIGKRIKKIVLYGSVISGQMAPSSDIDIAIDVPGVDTTEAMQIRKRLHGIVNDKVDIQIYQVLPQKIQSAIDGGREIYRR